MHGPMNVKRFDNMSQLVIFFSDPRLGSLSGLFPLFRLPYEHRICSRVPYVTYDPPISSFLI